MNFDGDEVKTLAVCLLHLRNLDLYYISLADFEKVICAFISSIFVALLLISFNF